MTEHHAYLCNIYWLTSAAASIRVAEEVPHLKQRSDLEVTLLDVSSAGRDLGAQTRRLRTHSAASGARTGPGKDGQPGVQA